MSRSFSIDRRGLVTGLAAAVAGLAADSALVGRAAARAPTLPAPVRIDRWEALRRAAGGNLIRPGEAGYAGASAPQNLRYAAVRPQAVASCPSPQAVADVLRWCQDYDMPFAVRGGGHSYAGLSTGHGLVLDVSPMKDIRYDAATGRVRVEAGALNGEVYQALRAHGRMVTHGRCPGVGVAGFLLGGGVGFNMRRLGVGSDLLVEAEIVTADGAFRKVSRDSEPELFWALRGGAGGNFGVSTAFTLDTVPADERVTVFHLAWTREAESVGPALLAALEAAPTSLGSRVSFVAADAERQEVKVDLLGQYAGPKAELLNILAPALAVAGPEAMRVEEMTYWDGQAFLSEPGEPCHYQERSAFLPGAVPAAMLAEAFRHLRRPSGTGRHSDLRVFQTGGRMNEVAADATAFVHRDSRWLMSIGLEWTEDDHADPETMRRAHRWQNGLYAAMRPFTGGAFQNFPDPSLVNWRDAYYGANLPRLKAVKAAYDPENLFRHGQSI